MKKSGNTIVQFWLSADFAPQQVLHIAIDRTNWGHINLLMISLIWDKRALPIYWELLPKQGNSNFEKQTAAITQILPLFKEYKVVVLGDREFCLVKLGFTIVNADCTLVVLYLVVGQWRERVEFSHLPRQRYSLTCCAGIAFGA